MSAPFKVLMFCTGIVIGFVFLVLYKFDLLTFKTAPVPSKVSEMTASAIPDLSKEIDLANGKKLFDVKTCVLCHGADGKSNTPMGKAVGATDLTAPKFKRNTENLPRMDYIFQVIENGIPGTAMVSFKSQIPNDQDKLDLAGYVTSLQHE